jgi:phosphoribosylformylglycinamidine synthase
LKANVYVTLKAGVLDPQGETVKRSLHLMGNDDIEEVRIGKFIQIKMRNQGLEQARRQLEEISDQLLANPVIEDFRVELAEGE